MPLQKRSVHLLKSSGPMMFDLILDVMNGFWQLRDAHTESAKTPLHRHFVPGYYRAVPPGRKPFSYRSGYRPLLEAMYGALLEMVEEGFVRSEEAMRMVIPTVGRSYAELVAPFAGDGCFAGLSIELAEVFLGEAKIWVEFEGGGDAHAFAARWAAFSRASVFPTLASGLNGGRRDPRADGFIDRLEALVTVRLAVAPERMLIPLSKLLIVKNEAGRL